MHPQIIILEGPDGCGKTSLAKSMYNMISLSGVECVSLRAPGGSPLGESLRDSVLLNPNLGADPEELALIFTAVLASVSRLAMKHVEEGKVVILDRWVYSMIVYQGSSGVPKDKLEALSAMFMPFQGWDDHVSSFLVSVPFDVCQERLTAADDRGHDRFESEGRAAAHRRWQGYEEFPDDALRRVSGVGDTEVIASVILEQCGWIS